MGVCAECKKPREKYTTKYCSNRCQSDYQYKQYISDWRKGKKDGNRGISTKVLSGHLRRFMIEKYGGKCSQCGWDKISQYTDSVPLEVDHIDGDADNNSEKNLRLLCANCHSLTPSFRNLNKGKGRAWRK